MSQVYVVKAATNGAGSGSLPAIGSLSPPSPPTLAYFQSKSAKFVGLEVLPLQMGPQHIGTQDFAIDTLLVYADGNASTFCGHVPGSKNSLSAGIANGAYIDRAAFRPA